MTGTMANTPAVFAVEWGRQFFDRFLGGEPAGKVILELRRQLSDLNHNLLGLLYRLYSNADSRSFPVLGNTQNVFQVGGSLHA